MARRASVGSRCAVACGACFGLAAGQAVESLDILGTIQQESVAPNPENVRSTCYAGLIEEITTKCYILDDEGEEVPPGVYYYEKTEGWNSSPRGESDVLCLQCCSQLYDEVNEEIYEEWNFECDVDSTVRQKMDTGYYGYEFRFARNRDEGDDKLVRCAMGRIGCEYEGIYGEYEMGGKPLSCTSQRGDDDFGYCSDDNSTCECQIPGSQRGGTGPHPDTNARNDYLDGVRSRVDEQSCRYRSAREREGGRSWYLLGYELTVEVEELSDNSGSYWRSVTGCSVKTTETEALRAGDRFFQRIVMKGTRKPKPYNWFASAHGLPFVVVAALLFALCGALLVRCVRNAPCPTCGRKLIFMPKQCFLCTLYGAPMPDPVLLARIRARSQSVHGLGFVAYTLRKKPGAEQTRAGCVRLYAGRACHATCVIAGRHVKALLKCVLVGLLAAADAALHFLYRCVLRRRRGPGPVCLRAFVTDETKYVERAPPVPTKIYVADPQLRAQNVFGRLSRPMPQAERDLVDAEQDHVRKFRKAKAEKKLQRVQARASYYAAANNKALFGADAKLVPERDSAAALAPAAALVATTPQPEDGAPNTDLMDALGDSLEAGSLASKSSKSSKRSKKSSRSSAGDGDDSSVASDASTPVLVIEQQPTG